MRVATLHIRNRHIEVTDIDLGYHDIYDLFYQPLSAIDGQRIHYYTPGQEEKLIRDYHGFLKLAEGAYYSYTQEALPLDLNGLPSCSEAIYDEGTFYFTHVHQEQAFYFLFGYLLGQLGTFEEMANGLCAAFYVIVSHIRVVNEGVADG